ncbi:histone H1t-like [Heteronotia binoei]|uniref:histone H1t-like n=1 Tax=Heteronotia binoei TaxID=13085 RepID=UPI0029301C8D|nr:histone H1t-like [Heteronotia binoei]
MDTRLGGISWTSWRSSQQHLADRRMVNGKQLDDSLLSEEGASGSATPASPVPKKRGRICSSYKAMKPPYSLSQLILQAFETCSARKGLSLAGLKKHLAEIGYNVHRHNSRLKRELNNLVSHGLLTRVSGTSGASGSFRFSGQMKKTGKSEPDKKEKAVAAKKSPKMNREQKKAQKQQPPINKSKNLQRKNSGGKNQPNNHPKGSNRNASGVKGRRRK